MKDNISTLYGALKNQGYTDIGKDETEFRNWLGQEGNVKTLYSALSQQGFDDIGDEQQFTDWVGLSPKQPEIPQEQVTKRILENKPDYFKPKKVDLMLGSVDKDKTTFDLMNEGRAYELDNIRKQRPITEFGEAFEQGTDALYQGGKNLVGETANVLTGSQRDYDRARRQLDELVASGYDLNNFDAQKALKDYKDRDFQRRMSEWQQEVAARREEREDMGFFESMLHKIKDPSRPKSQYESTGMFADELQLERSYHAIQDALNKSNGNVEEAYKLLGEKASKETWGDRTTREAREKLAEQRETKGFGAWVGSMIPQMIGTGAGLAVSLTPWGRAARFLGQANMMALTGATAGMSMAEARDYAKRKGLPINEGDIWRTGVVDAAIEYGTEYIPFTRYFNHVGDASNKFIGKYFANSVKGNSQAKKEFASLLDGAAKDFKLKYFSKDNIERYLTDVVTEGLSEFSAEALQTLSPIIYQNPEDYPTLREILENGFEGAKGGLFMGAFLGAGSTFAGTYHNRRRREKQGGVTLANTANNGVVEIVGKDEEGIHGLTADGDGVVLKDEDILEQRNYTLEEFDKAAKEKVMSDAEERIQADNESIDAATDTQTGNYAQVTAILPDGVGGTKEVVGNVVGWIGDSPIFVADGMENTEENRIVLKQGEWNPETLIERPAEEVKAINEEMVREEVAAQAERESKYAPEVLNKQMEQGIPFETADAVYLPIQPMAEGNGWTVEVQPKATNNKTASKSEVIELTNDEFYDLLQKDLEAQEAVQAESTPSESVGEQVNTPVNTEVNNPMETQDSTPMTPMSSPMSEEVQPAIEEKSTQPVIPTKKDGSVDYVAYGKENSLKDLGNQYGEKLPNKVSITAKAYADDLIAAQAKLDKAQEAVDNAPIGREAKQKKALEEAKNAYNEAKKEADFWAEMDADIKAAQEARKALVNPKVEVDNSNVPLTADEFVAQQLAAGNIVLTSESFKKETGYGEKERKKFPKLFRKAENGGMTIEEAGERLMEMDRENGTNFFDQTDANAGRDALIDMLGSVRTWGDITGYIRSNREYQAQRESEGLKNEIEEAIEANYHMTPEEYATLQEVESVENPFGGLDVATKDAIFVEAYEEYEQSLNPKQNDEGRTSEIAEGNGDVLSEERTDNEGGTSERQGERPDVSEGAVQQNDAAQEAEQVEEPLTIQEGESPVAFAERVVEEQRRKPLRNRANEWAKALGVKVTFLESIDEVDAVTRAQIESSHAKGDAVPGWVSRKGEVFFFMPDLRDLKDVDETYVHEVVAHIGMEKLLGKERFGKLCDKVWEMMSQSEKDYYMSYPGVKNHRDAADEYIAHLAEKENLTPEEKTRWDSIVQMFRDMLDRALNGIIGKSKLTDKDISDLIKASYANLKSGADGNVLGEGNRFRFSKTPQEFDAIQREAVEKKGIVMPGLNEAFIDVIETPIHDFSGKNPIDEARLWAEENLITSEQDKKENKYPKLIDGTPYEISKKKIGKFLSESATKKSEDIASHLSVLKKLKDIIASSIETEIHPDYIKKDGGRTGVEYNKNTLIHRFYGAAKIEGKIYRVKTTIQEYRGSETNKPHSYEVIKIKLLDAPMTAKKESSVNDKERLSNNIIDAANLLNGVEKSYDKGKKLLDESEKTRFRVVYHGSGAEFDKFDHAKMGTGAGTQVFGWGTYVTESEKIGRDYGDVALKSENRFIYVGDKNVNKWTVADAEQIMHASGSYEEAMKRYGNATLAPGTALEQAVTFLKSTKKEDWKGNRHLYEVEIPDSKRGNYIVWGNNVTDAAAKKVFDGIYNRLSKTEEYDNPTAKKELRRELNDLKSGYGQGQSGIWKDLYGDVSYYLGSDKEASLFLNFLGYVGIKYPAGTIYQGDYGNASNYVIFNENDLQIVEHTRFKVYKSKDGKETKYKQLSLFGEGNEAVNDRNRSDNIQREEDLAINRLNHLRELQEGEICNVERRFTESKEFSFTRGEKVESVADVAYIFKSLEDEAVENSFVAIANGDDVTVIHLGMGAQTQTVVDTSAIIAAVDRLNADKVFFVHNHPTGEVKCSRQDVLTYKSLKNVLGNRLEDGIIINTRSGKYGLFNSDGLVDDEGRITSEKTEYPIKVYKFNKQAFNVDVIPKVTPSSLGIAEFVSTQRLGKRDKVNALLLNNQFGCVGNILIDNSNNMSYITERITNDAIAMGARQVVIYGRYPFVEVTDRKTNFASYLSSMINEFSQGNVNLIDIIQIDEPYSKSANDEGVRFRMKFSQEEQSIIDKAKTDGTYMKAPNGERTNLTEKQWAQVRTDAFKKWFGDWENEPEKSSKIVDENGEPMVLFHQTENIFTAFDPNHRGSGTSDYETPFGIFMKPTSRNIGIRGSIQMPLYSKVSKPLVVKDRKHLSRWLSDNIEGYTGAINNLNSVDSSYKERFDKASEETQKEAVANYEKWQKGEITKEEYMNSFYDSKEGSILDEWKREVDSLSEDLKTKVNESFRKSGHDGIILKSDKGSFGRETQTIIALNPNQVKSATTNLGTFDPSNSDIRFRIAEKGKQIQAEVDKFTSKYNSKPVSVASLEMTDEELEKVVPTLLAEDVRKKFEKGSVGGYAPIADKIYIFADNVTEDTLEDTLFHENLHPMFKGNPMIEEFYNNFNTMYPEQAEMLAEGYEETEIPEELFVTALAAGMQRGNFKMVDAFLSEGSREELGKTLKSFGYDYEQERGRRNAKGNNGESPEVARDTKVDERSGRKEDGEGERGRILPEGNRESEEDKKHGSVGQERSSRKQAERLRNLFERVAEEGLRGVVGNTRYDLALIDVFHALPDNERVDVSVNAVRSLGGDVSAAVDEYLNEKDNPTLWEKVSGIIRDMLRKAGFDLDLTQNDVKYMLWRSKKPLDRSNLVDMAEDIYKKYQLKVGEYSTNDDGTTPDGGGTRFRVTPKMDAEYMEAVNSGNTKKVSKLVKDAAMAAMPNTKVVDRWGKPKVVYHGTISPERFNEFKGDAIYFTSSLADANLYSHERTGGWLSPKQSGRPLSFFLNIENPLEVDAKGRKWTDIPVDWSSQSLTTEDIAQYAKDNGYDGVIINKVKDSIFTDMSPMTVYIAFSSSQIKDAGTTHIYDKSGYGSWRIKDEIGATYDDNGNVIPLSERFNPEQKDIRFRVSNKLQVRDEYEATIKKGGYQAREAVQDAMLSLRRFQELIEKESGKKLKDFENAWMHENRLSSVVQAAIHEMERKYYKPMMESVKKLMKAADIKQEEVADYLMLKHGIERNREMAVRKALTDAEGKIDRTHLEQWYQEKEAIRNDASLDTWRKKQEAMDNLALNYGADMSRDYSGLTSMFDTDDIEECTNRAYDEVETLENAYPAETEALGKAVKAMTQNTLDESFGSGLMDRKVYDELSKDMYDYYIPLRGFEETTSEEVYAYLDQDRGSFNAPLQRAKGRSSKSDNPIAYLKSIAESGIMQGERNKMKQSFLNMVINHPSDLVSIHEGVWAVYNPASGEWEAAAPPAIPNNATPADVEAAMEAWEQQMEQAAQNDPTLVKKVAEAADVPYRVVGNRMNQHQIIVKRLGKSYTLTVNGNPRLAMALNGLTNPNNTSNDGKVSAYVSGKFGALNRFLASVYTTKNPDFVVSNFMRDTFYTNTIVRAKEGNSYANKFHKHYAELLMPGKMISLFKKYEKGTLDMSNATEAAFKDFMMNGGETGYSNLKDLENIKKQIAKDLKGNRLEVVEKVAEKLDILNRAVENTARFAAYLTSREEGRSVAKSVFDAKEISVNFNKKGAGGTFFGMTGQTKLGNLAAMVGAGGRALYVFFNAAIQGTTNLLHVMKKSPKGTSAGIAAMFLMGAVLPFLLDDDEEKDYYDLPEHVRRNHLILPGFGNAWISIPLPIEYRIMYGMGELLTSWRTGQERGSDIGRKMLNLTGQALPLNFLEEGFDAFIPSSLSPLWQVYNNKSWTGLPLYKDNEFNKDDPEYTKAYKNVDRTLYNVTKALYDWTFDEENQEAGINLNPAVLEALARGYFGGFATQLGNLGKTWEIIAGEREFDWRSIPIGNRVFKSGDERTKEKRITNEYFENMEKLDFMQSRERTLKKTINGVSVPQEDKDRAKEDYDRMKDTDIYKKYQEFKKKKKDVDKLRKRIKEKGSTEELEKELTTMQEEANKVVR